MSRDMHALWERFEVQAARTPLGLKLRPPASSSAIAEAEAEIGFKFPDDFRASMQVHDGQEPGDGEADALAWLPGHARLASLERIV